MKEPTAEDLMKLLHEMTGWGDNCCKVKIGYMRARNRIAQDGTEVDHEDWGWVATANVINGPDVAGQGKTLEDALIDVAQKIHEDISQIALRHNDKAVKVGDVLSRFNMDFIQGRR